MRIIAGHAKGMRLLSPNNKELRPTKDRVREALFSAIGPRIPGASFLDLFAGTGANGIEALSRGANYADFVDSDPESCELVRQNLERAKFPDRAGVYTLRLPRGLEGMVRKHAPYDIVFADPPYLFAEFLSLLELLQRGGFVAPSGIVVLEHASGRFPEIKDSAFELSRIARYGDSALAYCILI